MQNGVCVSALVCAKSNVPSEVQCPERSSSVTSGAATTTPFLQRRLDRDRSDHDQRTAVAIEIELSDPLVEVVDDLARFRLGAHIRQRPLDLLDLTPQGQGVRQRRLDPLAFELALDPPILVAFVEVGDRLARAGEVVELTPLDRLTDLPVDPAFEDRDPIAAGAAALRPLRRTGP